MRKRIKADFKHHWPSYTGFGGLLVIGIPMFTLIATPMAERLVLALFGWVFFSIGLFWEAQTEKLVGYISDEERNKPYV